MRKHVKKDLQTSEPVSEPVIFKLRLEAVSAPTASKLLADQLRNKILKGELLSGTTLPSERELVDQTGVSRGAVRQALALLQSDGLVETRPGRFGGSIIRRPSEDSLAEFLALFIEGRSIPLASLLQFREIIGAPMAALAASNRTARDLAEIKSIGDTMHASGEDVQLFLKENVKWQVAVATATQNEICRAVTTAISDLIYRASAMENFASVEVQKQVLRAHERIFQAIEARDAEQASRRMARHLSTITRDMRAFQDPHQSLT